MMSNPPASESSQQDDHAGDLPLGTEGLSEGPASVGRPERFDWATAAAALDAEGCAVLPSLLDAEECERFAASYEDDGLFRSRVVMARHGFGKASTGTSPIRCPTS